MGEDGAPDIEITPAMIEAGAGLLLGSGLVWYREPKAAIDELVREILEAAFRYSQAPPDKLPKR